MTTFQQRLRNITYATVWLCIGIAIVTGDPVRAVFAAVATAASDGSPLQLNVPPALGFIKERFIPTHADTPVIVNIQDLHTHYQAQQQIFHLLEYLSDDYGLNVISVEGGSGRIDTTFYQELPDRRTKIQVADYFLQQARISGAEYFAIVSDRPILFYGAEIQKYYDLNLNAYMLTLENRDRRERLIAEMENQLNIMKPLIYGDALRRFDALQQAYDNGEMNFEEYVVFLSERLNEKDMRRFPNVQQFLRLMRAKQSLLPEMAQEEFARLAQQVFERLSGKQKAEILSLLVRIRRQGVSPEQYYTQFRQWYQDALPEGDFDAQWPQIALHLGYWQQREQTNDFALFDEVGQLAVSVKEQLTTSRTERKLNHYLRVMQIARQLVATKVLPQDVTWMRRNFREFSLTGVSGFIRQQFRRYNLPEPAVPDLSVMRAGLPAVRNYYRYALRRNRILAERTLQIMRREKKNSAILICGGFHSAGIAEYCRTHGIGYVMIVPQVDDTEVDQTRYLNALRGEKTPFEKQMEVGDRSAVPVP